MTRVLPEAMRYALTILLRKMSTRREADALLVAQDIRTWLTQYETNKLIGRV